MIEPVAVATPEVLPVTLFYEYPATLQSNSKADVVGRVNGLILSKNFQEGSYVAKGQVLFTIESTTYAASAREAQASLENAKSQLDYATANLEALSKAFRSSAVSEMDVIQAKNNKIQAEASVNSALARLTQANTSLGYCTVIAPISGRITASTLDVGAYVGGEAAPVTLATIYNDDDLSVVFNVDESTYASLASNNILPGDSLLKKIPVNFDGIPTNSVTADLTYEAPAVDPSTGTLRLKGKITDSKGLKQGMYAKVSLPYGYDEHGVLVKDASIGRDQLGSYLYLVNDSNRVEYTHVEVGALYKDTLRLVTKGIKPGQRYVTSALLKVRQGMKVNPIAKR